MTQVHAMHAHFLICMYIVHIRRRTQLQNVERGTKVKTQWIKHADVYTLYTHVLLS